MTAEELHELREEYDKLCREIARCEGQLDGLFKRLKQEFGVISYKQGSNLLKEIKSASARLIERIEKERQSYLKRLENEFGSDQEED